MDDAIPGTRIRQRRRELGITQAALAKTVGISPSYLNLIEWNKRRIAGALLKNIADALDLTLEDIDGVTERRLRESLLETARLPALAAMGIEVNRTSELIGRFPGWARAMGGLIRSEQEATARAQSLSERLSNDPFLGETVHRMLTRIASVRSASEILSDYADVPELQRDRFNRIIQEESQTLTEVGEALALYIDKAEDTDRILTPLDEVEALFEARDNRFEEIETATSDLGERIQDMNSSDRQEAAHQLALENVDPVVDGIVASQPQIETELAASRAKRLLTQYAAGAILTPMAIFTEAAAEAGYDIEVLADRFSVEIDVICRRLTALPRNTGVPRFGYLRANAAGTIIEMLGLEGLAIPRYASACPLWVLYRTQQYPETVITQRTLFPNGNRFIFVARARQFGPIGFGRPRHYLTDMLTMRESDVAQTVYRKERDADVEEVGQSCRLCPRKACIHRVEDPLIG